MKSAFGSPTCLDLDRCLEKTQNLVSTKVPEVIESLKASCNGIGMVMTRRRMRCWDRSRCETSSGNARGWGWGRSSWALHDIHTLTALISYDRPANPLDSVKI